VASPRPARWRLDAPLVSRVGRVGSGSGVSRGAVPVPLRVECRSPNARRGATKHVTRGDQSRHSRAKSGALGRARRFAFRISFRPPRLRLSCALADAGSCSVTFGTWVAIEPGRCTSGYPMSSRESVARAFLGRGTAEKVVGCL
jgi:hypothetical protein